jgi:hypothetical protein
MAVETKYRSKYLRQLKKGMFEPDGRPMSKAKICAKWGISPGTFDNWAIKYPGFGKYALKQELEIACWVEDTYYNIMAGKIKGNAGTAQFAMKNMKHIEWKDKTEVTNHYDEQVSTINIQMLPPRNETKVIEHDDIKLIGEDDGQDA